MKLTKKLALFVLATAVLIPTTIPASAETAIKTATVSTAISSGTLKTTGNVHMRKGAGTGYRSIRVIPKNTKVSYLGQSQLDNRGMTWHKIEYKGNIGWTSGKYLTAVKTRTVSAATGDTWVRTLPSLSGKKLTVLTKGKTAVYKDSAKVDDRGVVWYKVEYKGQIGWVSSRYTKLK